MKLTLNIKPTIITARTKNEILNKISRNDSMTKTFLSSRNYECQNVLTTIGKSSDSKIRVYNLEKHRAKFKQLTAGTKVKTKAKTLVKDGHWIAYVYDIPEDAIKLLGLKIDQKTRNFTISGK